MISQKMKPVIKKNDNGKSIDKKHNNSNSNNTSNNISGNNSGNK